RRRVKARPSRRTATRPRRRARRDRLSARARADLARLNGGPTRYPGTPSESIHVAVTAYHEVRLARTALRVQLSRSDVVAALLELYAASLVVDPIDEIDEEWLGDARYRFKDVPVAIALTARHARRLRQTARR